MRTLLMLWFGAMFASTTTTEFVDTIEVQVRQNRDVFFAGPQTRDRQAAALSYFDQQWIYLKSPAVCGERLLGDAGARCVSDRQRFGKWPWEVYYRDPIFFAKMQ